MATKTNLVSYQCHLCSILCILSIHTVSAYYCDNDRCTEEEYCCGDNTCCPSYKVWDLWYFWCGVLFFLFLLSMCACLWRHRRLSNGGIIDNGYSYTALRKVSGAGSPQGLPTPNRYYHNSDKLFKPSLGTPPPYSHPSSGGIKVAGSPPSYAQVVGMRDIH
uniref:Vesicular, overexpressed in cancer, prosurvival protein 1 n=1 Tax=Arion vulgaris TaxID=1028688 RepID=A0A0B6YNS0_9EUPU